MHRHTHPCALLLTFVLLLAGVAGVVSLASPVTALTGAATHTVGPANVGPHLDDDEVARVAVPATQHLAASTLFGLAAEAAQPPTAGTASGGVHQRHHGPATQETGTRQDRAPPAITYR